MATKLNPVSLLLLAFVARHQEIYKDDPEMLGSFENLTEDDIEVLSVTKQDDNTYSGVIRSVPRNFETPTQKWAPADLQSPNTLDLASEELYASLEEALNQTTPGVYTYLGAEGQTLHALVVVSEADRKEALRDALKYSVANEQILWVGDDNSDYLEVDTPYLTGVIQYGVVKSGMRMLPEGSIMQLGGK